ncbi:3-phosphoshikimate 1-carboxyvinyltransferase [Acetitomaculum ruminis]|uniref:3-phosphoshikimate 1-carboxyvinyltransferase n=1 Tax=Acetitomaculum ruminis TaxID=2382 RepID=UPI002FE6BADF
MELEAVKSLKGEINIPGDKSISHRAIMLGSLAQGESHISNFLTGEDCLSTIDCFRKMGVDIHLSDKNVSIKGNGLHSLKKPSSLLYTGNSGTTTRIISGILSGQDFETQLNGDASIMKRPMSRIIKPLKMMNARIESQLNNDCTPLTIRPSNLKSIDYVSKIASAQVKSCILLAGMYAEGKTSVTEPYLSRNHTEIMVNFFGGKIETEGTKSIITPEPILEARDIIIPGDISSAAYFIAAALITPGSEVLIKNVGINPTRDGILTVCKKMGGNIELLNVNTKNGEKTADILVKYSDLRGVTIEGDIIPLLIDELTIIAVIAMFAKGTTIIKDAAELRVKESDRIKTITTNLSKMGANITETDDGMIIEGGSKLYGAETESFNDHRIAMSIAIASLNAKGKTIINNSDCVDISYPGFFEDLKKLSL